MGMRWQAQQQQQQQQFVQRQVQEALGQLRAHNLDVTNLGWTPAWEWMPGASPVPDDASRAPFIPALVARTTYLPMAGPPATQFDHPMFS